MIKLDVFDMCQSCPEFDIDVNKTLINDSTETVMTCTVIQCIHRERCKAIVEYLKKEGALSSGN